MFIRFLLILLFSVPFLFKKSLESSQKTFQRLDSLLLFERIFGRFGNERILLLEIFGTKRERPSALVLLAEVKQLKRTDLQPIGFKTFLLEKKYTRNDLSFDKSLLQQKSLILAQDERWRDA